MTSIDPVVLEIQNSRESEEPPLAMEQVLAALSTGGGHRSIFQVLFGGGAPASFLSLEIASVNSGIHFFLVTSESQRGYVESQLTAQYPRVLISPVKDYMPHFLSLPHAVGQLVYGNSFYLPLKTYKDVKDLDILSGVVGQLAKLPPQEAMALQIRITPAGSSWQRGIAALIAKGVADPNSTTGRTKAHPHARLMELKMNQAGFYAAIRLISVAGNRERAAHLLHAASGTFGVYSMGEGNSLVLHEPQFWQKNKLEQSVLTRGDYARPKFQVLGSSELASLWHPPGAGLSMIKNIRWGAHLLGEAPENLPIAGGSEEEKRAINFFARTEYKNTQATFGVKKADRRKHMYIIGKTGTGKSTLIANMAINDMKNGEGMAVIDPHGDLSDILLDYIPSHRMNDVAYLDPSDSAHPFHLNPLEVKNPAYRELIASGIVSIFYKLYHMSWGPRLEYILRNTILTLTHVPQSTFLDIPELLTNDRFREKVVGKLDDRVLRNFWLNEFNRLSPQMKSESISPILNKVGQFLSSKTIRNIVGSPSSTVDLERMMNEGKIVIVNLAQGKLGEDSSALLGAMIITKMQLAAMNRVYTAEENRRDFYLYVDEFQNFATQSFIKILSEARKYRLNLALANQYVGQIDEDVQKAIFGNAGSIISFAVGAADARMLGREFGEKYEEAELVGLGNFEIVLKLSIDNQTSTPFSAITLPLPRSRNEQRETVIRVSRERYTKKVE